MQEYKQDNNQSTGAFSFDPYAGMQKEKKTADKEMSLNPGYVNKGKLKSESSIGQTLRQVVGSALMSFGAAIIVFLVVVVINQKVKDVAVNRHYEDAWEKIEEMESNHVTYGELDDLYYDGDYEAMFEQYLSELGNLSFGNYSKQDFLSLLEAEKNADEWYEAFTEGDKEASYIFASYLYYTFDFLTAQDHYTYQDMDPDSQQVIDERIEEVRQRTMELLEMDDEELELFINSFRANGSKYVDYSQISEYARKVYGE